MAQMAVQRQSFRRAAERDKECSMHSSNNRAAAMATRQPCQHRQLNARGTRGAHACVFAVSDDGEEMDVNELEKQREELERLATQPQSDESESITGPELRALVEQQFGKPFDTRITQKRDYFNDLRLYLQVMWKYLGQKSFPLSAEQYDEQLQAVAELLTEWGVVQHAVNGLKSHKKAPGVSTVGARAIEVALPVNGHPES